MKKLMIAAAVVGMAALTQAATVSWKSGTMYKAKSATDGTFLSGSGNKITSGSAQMYYIGVGDYTTWYSTLAAAETLADQQTAMKSLHDALVGGTLGTKPAEGGTATAASGAMIIDDPKSYTGMTDTNPVNAYAAVIFSYTDNNVTYYVANVGTVEMKADVDKALNTMGTKVGGAGTSHPSIQGWVVDSAAAPEPTSGLLLLIGVAGLALRRRRA